MAGLGRLPPYDRVQRPLLWQVFRQLGVHGRILKAIQALYTGASYAISVHGRAGPFSPSLTGVKQGCPLSPTLFGLFLNGLHRFLQQRCPSAGFCYQNGRSIRVLQYADDVLLVDTCPARLLATVDAALEFCHRVGMQINHEKYSRLCCNTSHPPCPALTCNSVLLDVVQQAKHLGMHISASDGFAASMSALLGKQSIAGAPLDRQIKDLGAAPSVGLP